ncbi:amino acid ABC transporter permease [Bacillus cytotoxicus]|uniref:Polar amino acid ABC transporter, inner membrane subunit n=1 Tax=Bacillus cytotoxicus (strain DSM 22905 / CIP 110041 / 391-98 / NVH 391-98) TaxID=315749 RepID=A7GL84_BACCN|nr:MULTISPECIES: amino acid ABC transporter permease [Bacillus cereus group]ABS20892.1 polar amino acid ABC transporter, inner membrane subunit [Bacillus cytotoxicus NVH 391-98]AWC27528.1 amino acid ABC transporter permease [Bacillus cytotoxicus]AWC41097.1 amino acid ABC transporter permease [Bacillus cytotoxicus]AWC43628.1 amino acid ABC transporter permease [Bacillus cytotoxicus]AWC49028.1 amino acid ABC transporter permease [Bacillus cytotoxicus]
MDFQGAYTGDHIVFLLKGLLVTLEIAIISIFLSFLIGSIVGTVRYTKIPILSQIFAVIVEIIRNLPLLLIIFFTYFALPEAGLKLEIKTAAIVALTIFEAAMISEIVRSGLLSIEKGQIEAGRASGLSYIQTLWYIILPQALRRMVPPLVSQFISLLKDTSLAVVISLPELMHNAQIINGQNVNYMIPTFVLVACIYFVVNYQLSILSRKLEHH